MDQAGLICRAARVDLSVSLCCGFILVLITGVDYIFIYSIYAYILPEGYCWVTVREEKILQHYTQSAYEHTVTRSIRHRVRTLRCTKLQPTNMCVLTNNNSVQFTEIQFGDTSSTDPVFR